MRTLFRVALGCVLSIGFLSPAEAVEKKRHFFMKHDTTVAYTCSGQRRASCFPDELKGILAHIAKKTGKKPIVTSGHRPRARANPSTATVSPPTSGSRRA